MACSKSWNEWMSENEWKWIERNPNYQKWVRNGAEMSPAYHKMGQEWLRNGPRLSEMGSNLQK